MSQLIDFIPIALFAAVFFASDIYWATGALMVAVTVQAVVYLAMRKPLSRELKITFWASLIFGGMTLIFHNETFIQWKPTIVYWIMSGSLIGSAYFGRENLLKRLFSQHLTLVDEIWARLNAGWALGLFCIGVLNLVIAYNFSMETWVTFKLVGTFALTLLFTVATVVYLSRKGLLSDEGESAGDDESNAPNRAELETQEKG